MPSRDWVATRTPATRTISDATHLTDPQLSDPEGEASAVWDVPGLAARMDALEGVVSQLVKAAEADRAIITSLCHEMRDLVAGLRERDGLREESETSERRASVLSSRVDEMLHGETAHPRRRSTSPRRRLSTSSRVDAYPSGAVHTSGDGGWDVQPHPTYPPRRLISPSSTASIRPPTLAVDHYTQRAFGSSDMIAGIPCTSSLPSPRDDTDSNPVAVPAAAPRGIYAAPAPLLEAPSSTPSVPETRLADPHPLCESPHSPPEGYTDSVPAAAPPPPPPVMSVFHRGQVAFVGRLPTASCT